MFKLILTLLILSLPTITMGDDVKMNSSDTVLKVSVLASNVVLLNGTAIGLDELSKEFATAAKKNGAVWYYRENAADEPPPASTQVIKMIIGHKLAISFSTKPDFSDYVDENGVSKMR